MDANELALELLKLEEVPDPRQRARKAGVDEICILVTYADGSVGVTRCLASGRPR